MEEAFHRVTDWIEELFPFHVVERDKPEGSDVGLVVLHITIDLLVPIFNIMCMCAYRYTYNRVLNNSIRIHLVIKNFTLQNIHVYTYMIIIA